MAAVFLNTIICDPAKRSRLEARFWPKVEKRGPDECWPWKAKARHVGGYGSLSGTRVSGPFVAHRVAWALINGPIANGDHILHSCDNPPCCNPSHLRADTHQENMREALERSSLLRNVSKLTAGDVRSIRATGGCTKVLARAYGVHRGTIYSVLRRATWKEID